MYARAVSHYENPRNSCLSACLHIGNLFKLNSSLVDFQSNVSYNNILSACNLCTVKKKLEAYRLWILFHLSSSRDSEIIKKGNFEIVHLIDWKGCKNCRLYINFEL